MNVKCFHCGTVHNFNFCPNCGAPAQPPYPNGPTYFQPVRKRHMSTGSIIVVTMTCVFVFMGVVFALGLIANYLFSDNDTTTSSASPNEQLSTSDNSIDVVLDAMQYWTSDSTTVTEKDLKASLGEPDSIDEWQIERYQVLVDKTLVYDYRSLYYGDYEYIFLGGMLLRISIDVDISYSNSDDLLAMFGLKEYANTKITDNYVSYRAENCGVPDFWIPDMDDKTIKLVNITYDDWIE